MASILATLIWRVPNILYLHGRPSPEGLRRPIWGGPDPASRGPIWGMVRGVIQTPDPDPRSRSEIGISRNTLITTSKRSIWDPI